MLADYDLVRPPSGSNPLGAIAHRCGAYRDSTQLIYSVPTSGVTVAAKTVALDAEAYELLVRAKRPGETFSEVVRRKLRPPSRISDLAGSLSEVPSGVWSEIEQERAAHRRSDSRRRRLLEQAGNGP